jgi:CRISPR system Cascade subunit CasC
MAKEDPHALLKIHGAEDAFRSRELVSEKIIAPYVKDRDLTDADQEVVDALSQWFHYAIYSGNPKEKPTSRGATTKADTKKNRPTLLFGQPELTWLCAEFARLCGAAEGSPDKAFQLGKSWVEGAGEAEDGDNKKSKKKKKGSQVSGYAAVIAELRKTADFKTALPSALFGRMVTSDPAANIDAPIHVAHAFTVHEEETESDYFVAVDDLKRDEDDSGADTIQETELTSGLFYGYVVVDVPGLVSNLTGCERHEWTTADRTMAAAVVHNLIYLIAEVSPGAKLGSTAPYGRAEMVLVEAGDRQPRSLSAAFREPVAPSLPAALVATSTHLATMDRLYETGEARRALHTLNEEFPGAPRGSLREIAEWAKAAVLEREARA